MGSSPGVCLCPLTHFLFKKKKKKVYFSFIFGCAGSLLWHMGFSNGGTQALQHMGSVVVVGRLP